jgi:hypothetical protein
MVVQ